MSFTVRHRLGHGETDPPLESLESLYEELSSSLDELEHGDVSVGHVELEECLVAYRSGLLGRESFASDRTRHLKNVSREKVLELWRALSRGDMATIDSEPWCEGYG